jgi:hypothetical protein
MQDGIYRVDFQSSDDGDSAGNGVVVVRNGALNGGDLSCVYQGHVKTTGKDIVSKVGVFRYDTSQNSVFGSLDRFDLELSGTMSSTLLEFELSGAIVGHPQQRIAIIGKKLCDLM